MKYLLRAVLFNLSMLIAMPVSANLFDDATESLNSGNYEQAYQTFSRLLPLANSEAAVQLGFMTLDELGTEYEPIRALAYFYVANRWNHPEARELIDQVEPHLDPEEVSQARQLVSRILENQIIHETLHTRYESVELEALQPRPVERNAPQYPTRTFNRYDGGWATARVLVQPDGQVSMVDVVQSSSETFTRQVVETLPEWSYESSDKPIIDLVNFTFSLTDDSSVAVLLRHVQNNLWDIARFGSIEHQRELGLYLQALQYQRGYRITFDRDTTFANAPSFDHFLNGEDGDQWPLTWSGGFWLNYAAQQGDIAAQRALALTHSEWAEYLILQGDERTQAWRGLTLYTRAKQESDREHGLSMLVALNNSEDEMVQAILDQIPSNE